ncbi:MAG: zinc ribbon domain-containing protein, partial [Nitrososphaerota archaeon]
DENGYTTQCTSYVIGGIGVSGYTNVEYNFSRNASPLNFFVPQESLLVLIMDGGNTSSPGAGIPGLNIAATAVGTPYTPDVIIGYADIGSGSYEFIPNNRTTTYGNGLTGVFLFQNKEVSYSSVPTIENPTALSQQSSVSLPSGSQMYLYGFQSGGSYPTGNFTNGAIPITNDPLSGSGYIYNGLAITPINQNSYSTETASYVIAGVGISDYASMEYNYSTLGKAVNFTLTAESLVVVVQDGGNLTEPGSGIAGLNVAATALGSPYDPDISISYADLAAGKYQFEPNKVTPYYGVGITGIFAFYGSVKSSSQYTVDFTQTGLPSGTLWSVTLNGTAESSTSNSISFLEPNGTYQYDVEFSGSGYTFSPQSGTVDVKGSSLVVPIVFSKKTGTSTSLPLHTGPQSVVFSIVSNPYISATYEPTISISSGTMAPGSTTNATASLSGTSLPVTLTIPSFSIAGQTISGMSRSLTVDPLGSHYYAVPGATFNYVVVSGGIYIGVTGEVSGTLSFSGNGTGLQGGTIVWNSANSFPVEIHSLKNSTGNVTITLGNLKYILLISLYAEYSSPLGGGNYTILSPTTVGDFQGNPSYVNGVFTIEKQSKYSFPSILRILYSPIVDILLFAVVLLAATIPLTLRRKRKKKMKQKISESEINYSASTNGGIKDSASSIYHCKNCGEVLEAEDLFCPKCGTKRW